MKRDYELGFILNPEVSEEETGAILARIEQIVANHDGQIVKVSHWGRRRLAYPIERHRDGYYIFIDMILTPETVSEIERALKVSEIVLRHMIRRRDPKAVQKEREEREAREARAAAEASAASTATEVEAEETQEVTTDADQTEEAPVLSAEETENIPPALEESASVEA